MSTCTVAISGTATGASCVSYGDCNTTCCTKSLTGCSGTNNHACAYLGPFACNGDVCCVWDYEGAGICHIRTCVDPSGSDGVDPVNCAHCGCADDGSCTTKTCAQVAAINNNPDVCAGCNTCGGDWQIDNNRGDTPWSITVTGALDTQAGGRVDISGGHTLAAGSWTPASGGTVGFSSGGILALG